MEFFIQKLILIYNMYSKFIIFCWIMSLKTLKFYHIRMQILKIFILDAALLENFLDI